jgi:hypothetical protein
MKRISDTSESIGFLRGDTGDLSVDPRETIEIAPVEQVPVAGQSGDATGEVAERQQEEKIDHWMENIKEFIRNIDVKQL